MTIPSFEEAVRGFKYKSPFAPFVIELTDSRTILVDDPDAIGLSNGTMGYIDADGNILTISYQQVSALRPASLESAK
ncbi:MAG: YgdI/YgdR family lipoprotein [Gemmataceae bacterium]|nr:YgdI/YgdR family lipoprotein [Gemmataceae bacterium]MCI0740343.1 YgdI/YgdR family lipoprotein [Gemmataceae bacterium]